MRISLNWLKKYVDVPVSDEELVRLIGARLVEVEGVIDEMHKYDKIYVVRVASAEKIPDTHLTLCQIDVGDKNLVQVVCGAPNVREGMLAVWIAPGAVVPASVREDAPFVIGVRKMQGYESNGMLAGADELDFGDDHSGIVEIDSKIAKPGELLADVFELRDLILDIENKSLTHRPDTFGVIGFAREVYGILGAASKPFSPLGLEFEKCHTLVNVRNIHFSNSNLTSLRGEKGLLAAPKVTIQSPDICRRYSAVVLEKHGEMKRKYLTWMDTVLSKSGMRPIGPIVDVTNYLMLLTGQPLHAFDYDKFVAVGGTDEAQIGVRLARKGEKLVLLNDEEIELNENDIVICSNDIPVALAGAMGGKSTEIDENTRNVMIESATFSLYNLRKTQMEHGIFSEAVTRFTKGQPDFQTLDVAVSAAEMLSQGFKVVATADKREAKPKETVVAVTTEQINGLLGTEYSDEQIVKTLSNVGFFVRKNKQDLEVTVPEWRTDIAIPEDIIEEVGRLNGYDNIVPTLPKHGTAMPNEMWTLKARVGEILKNLGANEILTYSFVSGRLLEKAGQDAKKSYKIVNSISPELQYIRQSIVPSLLDKAYVNQKLPVDQFAIFEMNQVYSKSWGSDSDGVPVPKMSLGLVLAERKTSGAAYYKVKQFAEKLFDELGVKVGFGGENPEGGCVRFLPKKHNDEGGKPFEDKRAAEMYINGERLGVLGEFKNSVRRNYKLNEYLAGFEIDLGVLMKHLPKVKTVEVVMERDKRDLTVKWNKSYGELISKIEAMLKEAGAKARISPLAIYQPETDKFISVHLEFEGRADQNLMEKLESL